MRLLAVRRREMARLTPLPARRFFQFGIPGNKVLGPDPGSLALLVRITL